MKDLSFSKKLTVGFGIILIFVVLSTVIAIFSISRISHQVELYEKYTVPNISYINDMKGGMLEGVSALQEAMLATDRQTANAALKDVDAAVTLYKEAFEAFKNNQPGLEMDADIGELEKQSSEAMKGLSEIKLLLTSESQIDATSYNTYAGEHMSSILQLEQMLNEFYTTVEAQAAVQGENAESTTTWAWILLIASIMACILITIIVVKAIRKSIITPMNEIISTFEQVARGNMTTNLQYKSQDEFGRMSELIQEAFTKQDVVFGDFLEKLTRISKGDLQFEIEMEYHGDFQKIKKAMEDTVAGLNDIIETISIAADQVRTGAAQVSDGAQALAMGSTQQASSIQELITSVASIAVQADENSANVKIANGYVEKAAQEVQNGNEHMKQLTMAMQDISTSSTRIANIIKLIEDIAFQTNILALNAAVEAARAGSAGKGFAVVADEVRNLAAKSADAAKQTAELIRTSVASVANGTKITEDTAAILEAVGVNTLNVTESFEKIEKASAEQSMAIEQIKQGIALVSDVVQTNASTSEENSATSEEMSAQADTLGQEVARFKLKSAKRSRSAKYIALQHEAPQLVDPIFYEGSDLGKY
ncbi:MAG: methyl-accepting chemotaxis protein [Eubacteriales bacterium]|nr:methyl-accepting chemotaxis protein [Eubacteriales bacterium]MDD4389851.1 methyl-accepting chemotaxis protein [Eubacteriales bacterium]